MEARDDKDSGAGAGEGQMGRGIGVLFGEAEDQPPMARRATPAGSSYPLGALREGGTDELLDEMLSQEATAAQPARPERIDEACAPAEAAMRGSQLPDRRPVAPDAQLGKAPTAGAPLHTVRVGGVLMDLSSDELSALVPPGPGVQVTPEIEIEPRAYSSEDQQRILSELDMERRNALMQQVDNLYEITSSELASHQEHSGTALKLLHEARTIIIERPYAFADAELRMQAAKALIKRTQDSRTNSRRSWPWLFAYEIVWALLLLAGLVLEGVFGDWLSGLSFVKATTMEDLFPAWGTMMAGGLGGVICALWSMWYHISDQQDYDPQHNLWYLVQPLQGMVLGIVVYLVIAAGFLAFQTDISSASATKAAKFLPWLVAAIAGIRQTFIYELLDRIVGVLNPKAE
jgi:hypothetical protein